MYHLIINFLPSEIADGILWLSNDQNCWRHLFHPRPVDHTCHRQQGGQSGKGGVSGAGSSLDPPAARARADQVLRDAGQPEVVQRRRALAGDGKVCFLLS